jgi:hypothetical protein
MEGMDPQFLERVVDTLFPKAGEESRPLSRPRMAENWSPKTGVSEEELAESGPPVEEDCRGTALEV